MDDLVLFTEYLIKGIVKDPDMVKVQKFEDEDNNIILEVIVHSDDMGLVIGKGGKMINSIRTLIQAAAYNKGLDRVKINIDSF